MTIHYWKNHKIEVKCKSIAKHLWFSVYFEVIVDDESVFKSPDKYEGQRSTVPFIVIDNEQIYKGIVNSKIPLSLLNITYSINIDDELNESGKAKQEKWYMTLITGGLLGLAVAYVF